MNAKRLLYIGVSLMVLGFKSPNNSLVKSPKALSIGNATALAASYRRFLVYAIAPINNKKPRR
ncbi:MAG: hypothetical protein KME54_24585 [Tolypothrix brevis GSE-NOS-MK-07-07A]|nr:hypothetical protein [Tolypothrix brevis GSE-NOS-MK-07-07A]